MNERLLYQDQFSHMGRRCAPPPHYVAPYGKSGKKVPLLLTKQARKIKTKRYELIDYFITINFLRWVKDAHPHNMLPPLAKVGRKFLCFNQTS